MGNTRRIRRQTGPRRPGPAKATTGRRPSAPTRRRFTTNQVAYGLFGAMLAICSGGFIYDAFVEHKDCVDARSGQVVEPINCRHATSNGVYRWYYGGTSRGIGTKATGGSYERGGFGRFLGGGGG
jgi:hypothetical protein